MENLVVGIDVSKSSFVAAMQAGDSTKAKKFSNDDSGFEQLQRWLSEEDAWICLEATGSYGLELAAWLVDQNYRVSVVNPARVKSFANSELTRNKTDRSDASLLVRFCTAHQPDTWTPKRKSVAELQQLIRRLRILKNELTEEKNRLQEPHFTSMTRNSIKEHINFLKGQIEKLWEQIETLVNSDQTLQESIELLESIPGIGWQTAAKLVAEIQDIEQFESAKQLAAHAGVTPENAQSGTSRDDPAHMTKTGSRQLRDALYMPALSARTHNPVIRSFCKRLEAKGKKSAVVIGAAMHKLIRLVYGVWKNHEPFDPKYALNT